MESAALTDQHPLKPAPIVTEGGSRPPRSGTLIRDIVGVICLAVASLLTGLAINHLRAAPLPLVYQTPEQRLAAELTTLVEAPAFRLSDADTISLVQIRGVVGDHQTIILDARGAESRGRVVLAVEEVGTAKVLVALRVTTLDAGDVDGGLN